jgi:hypothetical protein
VEVVEGRRHSPVAASHRSGSTHPPEAPLHPFTVGLIFRCKWRLVPTRCRPQGTHSSAHYGRPLFPLHMAPVPTRCRPPTSWWHKVNMNVACLSTRGGYRAAIRSPERGCTRTIRGISKGSLASNSAVLCRFSTFLDADRLAAVKLARRSPGAMPTSMRRAVNEHVPCLSTRRHRRPGVTSLPPGECDQWDRQVGEAPPNDF